MTEYKAVTSDKIEEMVKQVNNLLVDNWELQGGISVSVSETEDYVYQTFAQALKRER